MLLFFKSIAAEASSMGRGYKFAGLASNRDVLNNTNLRFYSCPFDKARLLRVAK